MYHIGSSHVEGYALLSKRGFHDSLYGCWSKHADVRTFVGSMLKSNSQELFFLQARDWVRPSNSSGVNVLHRSIEFSACFPIVENMANRIRFLNHIQGHVVTNLSAKSADLPERRAC